MLKFINDLPADVVGVYASGEVNKEDYERVLIPRMEELAKKQGEISYLLVLETDVQNFSAAAWWQDFKLGLKNFGKWKKIAVVTDQKGVEWFTDFFEHFIPGESRGYKLSELNDAIDWVSHDEEPEPAEISSDEVKENVAGRSSNKGQGPAGENL
ncbi:SpoIIAA family protein [Mucilaginibacter ginsenosidivorans]|uniref:STAS/SEC14 domain-containing protein n=1 Tax=Mucilaginibacter ginsenosidivorans TaxID=398053 RepID=A0A5B8UWK4_9SPHI|nr:STAS/SEC14 domain-containing protein [Mucilaginibacter ginsenosidivorans]QEC63527.1 STAS/SEC14 domain-containing protein [Mucilaginibacter ginsenosidivorans]